MSNTRHVCVWLYLLQSMTHETSRLRTSIATASLSSSKAAVDTQSMFVISACKCKWLPYDAIVPLHNLACAEVDR